MPCVYDKKESSSGAPPAPARETRASIPGNAKFSYKKYYPIRRMLFSKFGSFSKLGEKFKSDMRIQGAAQLLMFGDTQPAMVCSTEPLLVAAYSDEMDAVVMLKFPSEFVSMYDLRIGTRLVTSNYYAPKDEPFAKDIFVGKDCSNNWNDFYPIVQLFIAKNDEKIKKRTELFDEELWAKVERLAAEYLNEHPDTVRDGFFYLR